MMYMRRIEQKQINIMRKIAKQEMNMRELKRIELIEAMQKNTYYRKNRDTYFLKNHLFLYFECN